VFEISIIIFLALAAVALLGMRMALERGGERPLQHTSEPPDRYGGLAMPGSPVAKGLDAIMAADKDFDVNYFIVGAEAAYEMTVTAYAEGDRRKLTKLLAPEVYEGFAGEILEREARGEKVETRFVSVDIADILTAELRGKTVRITVRFVSEILSVTRDRGGTVIDGSADIGTSVTDVWTFARSVTSRDPNWKIVATKNGA
jgi:predicted lipid-binding transport protein (Tim44 family)